MNIIDQLVYIKDVLYFYGNLVLMFLLLTFKLE